MNNPSSRRQVKGFWEMGRGTRGGQKRGQQSPVGMRLSGMRDDLRVLGLEGMDFNSERDPMGLDLVLTRHTERDLGI